jgi:hypothetical protein
MVIDDLDVECTAIVPDKTDTPLIVNSNAVLARSLSFESLQRIAGRNLEIAESPSVIDHPQFPPGNMLNIMREPAGSEPTPDQFGFAPEALDHDPTITCGVIAVKRGRAGRGMVKRSQFMTLMRR